MVCFLLLKGSEKSTASFTPGRKAGLGVHGVYLLHHGSLYVVAPQTGCDLPDVLEGDAREAAAPADGVWDPTEDGGDDITQGFPQIEAFVGEFPHAVNGVGVVRLSYGFLE